MTVKDGGGGGVEAPVERMRVERTIRENEKKKENEWWRIVGSGVRWGHTWSTKVLTFFLEKKKKKQMGRYNKTLAYARDTNGETALHVLARKPSTIANKSDRAGNLEKKHKFMLVC